MKTYIRSYRVNPYNNTLVESLTGSMIAVEWENEGIIFRTIFKRMILDADLRVFKTETFDQIKLNNVWKTTFENDSFICDDNHYVDRVTGEVDLNPYENNLNKPISGAFPEDYVPALNESLPIIGYEQKLKDNLISESQYFIDLFGDSLLALIENAIKKKKKLL